MARQNSQIRLYAVDFVLLEISTNFVSRSQQQQ